MEKEISVVPWAAIGRCGAFWVTLTTVLAAQTRVSSNYQGLHSNGRLACGLLWVLVDLHDLIHDARGEGSSCPV
jgi:hypothetical protein